ncbi:MAG: ABC transporter permease [Deltaproteobacteria bacterium]|nr:ABC transporter permease [Deltaproteobacteria bacterium]
MIKILRYLGSAVLSRISALSDIWEIIAFSLYSLVFRFKKGRKATKSVLLKQIYFAGFEAVPIVSWIALALGIIIVTQSFSILPKVGGEGLIGDILVWVVIREIGPIFSAIIVVARSGTAIASELGSMKISKELTALEIIGIDPMHYLIAPRVIGTCISVFVLTFYFEIIAVLGGYLLAGFGKRMTFSVYIADVLASLGFAEIGSSVLKSVLFGLIIGAVCCLNGMKVQRSITEIPQRTTKAVIGSFKAVFLIDAVVTLIFFMF